MSASRRRRALDRDELGAVDLRGEEEARAHGDPVEPHRACPADAVLAADVRAREPEAVANEIGQQQRLDVLEVVAAVDGDGRLRSRRLLRRPCYDAIDENAHEVAQVLGQGVDRAPRLDLLRRRVSRTLGVDLEERSGWV